MQSRFRYFIALLGGALLVTMTPGASTAGSSAPSIIGGHPAPIGSTPAIVAIGTKGRPAFDGAFCGGTLIRSTWVVTAAHCLEGERARGLIVHVGRTILSSRAGSTVAVRRLVRARWNPRTDRNDIALLELATPVTQAPMPLVRRGDRAYSNGRQAVIAGWGGTRRNGSRPADHLREGNVRMVAHWRCENLWGDIDAGSQVCAGRTTATTVVDSCPGDSGGPLTVLDARGVRRLAGVTSFGGDRCGIPHEPGVYTKVLHYRAWIHRIVDG